MACSRTRKLRHYDLLFKPGLEGGAGGTAAEIAHAVRRQRRRGHPAADQGTNQSRSRPACGQTGNAEGGVMSDTNFTTDGTTVTVRVPISIQRRGGRKLVLAPDGAEVTAGLMRPFAVGWTEQRKSNFCWKNSTFVSAKANSG